MRELISGLILIISNLFTPVTEAITPVAKVDNPAPFAFEELTIPYLRDRKYSSTLQQLTPLGTNANYNSYLTSYDSDGLKINGLLTRPVGTVPSGGWPAIVFVHGYIPPTIYRTQSNYSTYVDYLAKNGFVVFKIDLRGHDKSEGDARGAYYSSGYVVDTLNAYSALQNSDFVNKTKIGLWGHSMAGNVVFRSFVAKRDIPAVVVWAGAGYTYTDLLQYRISDASYRPPQDQSARNAERQKLREYYGNFDPDSWFWRLVTPTNFLEGVKGKIQVHHAVDDQVVSIDYSRNLMTILGATQIAHELFEYSSGGHNISGTSFNAAMNRTVEFFRDNL